MYYILTVSMVYINSLSDYASYPLPFIFNTRHRKLQTWQEIRHLVHRYGTPLDEAENFVCLFVFRLHTDEGNISESNELCHRYTFH